MANANDESLYFCPHALTMQRSLDRYAKIAERKGAATTDKAEKLVFEKAKRQLDVIELCMRLHKIWQSKASLSKGAADLFILGPP
jgi:hypothetical protein